MLHSRALSALGKLGHPFLDDVACLTLDLARTLVGVSVAYNQVGAVYSTRDNQNRCLVCRLKGTSGTGGRRHCSVQPWVKLAVDPKKSFRVGVVPPTGEFVDTGDILALGDAVRVNATAFTRLVGEPQRTLALKVFAAYDTRNNRRLALGGAVLPKLEAEGWANSCQYKRRQ